MFQRFDADGGEPRDFDLSLRLGLCDHPGDRELRLSQRGGWQIIGGCGFFQGLLRLCEPFPAHEKHVHEAKKMACWP